MKNNRKFSKYHIFIFYLIITVIFIFPLLFVHSPSLMDDGTDLLQVQQNSYINLFTNELFKSSRTCPLKLIHRKILFDLFGINLANHFLFQSILLLSSVLLVFKLLRQIEIKYILAILGGLIIYFLPGTASNFYRLGTAEHLQLLVFLISLVTIDSNWSVSFFFTVLNLFIKETSVFLLLVPFIWNIFFQSRVKKRILYSLIVTFLFIGLLSWKMLVFNDPYIHQARFDIANVFKIIFVSPINIIIVYISSFFYIFFRKYFSPKEILILLSSWVFVLPTFIWNMESIYYQYPFQVTTVILMIIMLNKLYKYDKSKKHFLSIFIITIVLIIFCKIWIKESLSEMNSSYRRHIVEGALSSFIMNNDWNDYHVYSSISDFEANHKIFVYFTEWNIHRPVIFFPDMDKWFEIGFLDTFTLNELAGRSKSLFINDNYSKKILIKKKDDLNSGIDICGFSPFIEEVCDYQIITGDKLYSYEIF